jgi:hypothetical protein
VAALFAVPSALSKYLCEKNHFRNINYYHFVVIFELLVSCVLPLSMVAFSYVMTARHLVVSSCVISEGTQNPQPETRRNTAKKCVGASFCFSEQLCALTCFLGLFHIQGKRTIGIQT